jgi:hypothetical protein
VSASKQIQRAQLAHRPFGLEQVAALNCALETCVCSAWLVIVTMQLGRSASRVY